MSHATTATTKSDLSKRSNNNQRYFVLCNSCFWCASYLRHMALLDVQDAKTRLRNLCLLGQRRHPFSNMTESVEYRCSFLLYKAFATAKVFQNIPAHIVSQWHKPYNVTRFNIAKADASSSPLWYLSREHSPFAYYCTLEGFNVITSNSLPFCFELGRYLSFSGNPR